jgi:hypothetical protein
MIYERAGRHGSGERRSANNSNRTEGLQAHFPKQTARRSKNLRVAEQEIFELTVRLGEIAL